MHRSIPVLMGIAILILTGTGCIFSPSRFSYNYEVQVRREGGLKPVSDATVVLETPKHDGRGRVEGRTDRSGFCYLTIHFEVSGSLHGVFYPCAPDVPGPQPFVVTVTKQGYRKARHEFTSDRFILEGGCYRLSEAIPLFQ